MIFLIIAIMVVIIVGIFYINGEDEDLIDEKYNNYLNKFNKSKSADELLNLYDEIISDTVLFKIIDDKSYHNTVYKKSELRELINKILIIYNFLENKENGKT